MDNVCTYCGQALIGNSVCSCPDAQFHRDADFAVEQAIQKFKSVTTDAGEQLGLRRIDDEELLAFVSVASNMVANEKIDKVKFSYAPNTTFTIKGDNSQVYVGRVDSNKIKVEL